MFPLIAGVLTLVIIIWFYGFVPRFGFNEYLSLFGWLMSAWNGEAGLEHGLWMPFVILGLIGCRFKDLRNAAASGRVGYPGLIAVFFGALLFVVSYRVIQPRFAAVGLPILLWGACHFLWGWRVAKIVFFPLIFFWLVVPIPHMRYVTIPLMLQMIGLVHHLSALCGVETMIRGTMILPASGKWLPIHFDMVCRDGIYALMPLLIISAGWAYVAKIRMWQKTLLFLAAIPIAIIANALRLTSMLVISEYGDPRWAVTTWHDCSGLLLVYPFSILLLLALHSCFLGGLPWKKKAGGEVV